MTDAAYKQKRALLAQFWKEMTANYGKRWSDEGDLQSERFALWLEGISHFRTDEIRDGILASRRSTSPHPPSLSEFRGLIDANRKRTGPANADDELRALEERTAARLLAGAGGNGKHRIIKRGDQYVHQVNEAGDWIDSDFMVKNPDGMTHQHRKLAASTTR